MYFIYKYQQIMKIEDLEKQVEDYKHSLFEITRKRSLWNSETKDLINSTLSEITNKYEIDWRVHILNKAKNLEGVNISIGNRSSGISTEDGNGTKTYIKKGGVLVFSQAYNGDVFVLILYPSVEEFVTDMPNKLVERIDPAKIDKEFIISKVSGFLQEMVEWENSNLSS